MSSTGHFPDGRGQGKAPEKSIFVETCNLLSRYMKGKGSLRDLNLEIGGKVESLQDIVKPGSSLAAPAANSEKQPVKDCARVNDSSSNIITVLEDASNKATTSKEGARTEPKTAQLTIFYSGRVLVFDDYPADKARELVSVAKKDSSQMSCGVYSIQQKPTREGLPPRPPSKLPLIGISSNTNATTPTGDVASASTSQEELLPQSDGSDLPIARRSSLHRFLEKRKDRGTARGPYQNREQPASSSKADEQLDLNL